jgi:hypothetical protein
MRWFLRFFVGGGGGGKWDILNEKCGRYSKEI